MTRQALYFSKNAKSQQKCCLKTLLTLSSVRRMFPSLKVSVSGLREETLYDICLVITSMDCRRYRYVYQRYHSQCNVSYAIKL